MELTGPQLRTLRWYLEHRDGPPTLGGFLRRSTRMFILWVACGVLCTALFTQIGMPEGVYVIVGMFLGGSLREIRQHNWAVQVWPAVAAVVNWELVERLVAEAGRHS
jgi:hypothetical protein